MKRSILSIAFLLCAIVVFGQNKQETVRLNNGSVVSGTVVGEMNDSVAVQTSDGSVFIFAASDITERTQSATQTSATHSISTPPRQIAAQKPEPAAASQSQVVYIQPRKSPQLAGLFSLVLPGMGQFYVERNQTGWVDFGEHVVSMGMMYGGYYYALNANTQSGQIGGLKVALVGAVWGLTNWVCSIVDAVHGADEFNFRNGYVTRDFGGVSVGARPQLTYEHPEYTMQVPNSMNAGMSFRIAF